MSASPPTAAQNWTSPYFAYGPTSDLALRASVAGGEQTAMFERSWASERCRSKRRHVLMTAQPIRYDDGAAYERMMGTWSRLAGETFLDWLSPRSGLRWIDVGCGNGAFTEL